MPLHLDGKSTPGLQAIDWQRVAIGYEGRIAELEAALRRVEELSAIGFHFVGMEDESRRNQLRAINDVLREALRNRGGMR